MPVSASAEFARLMDGVEMDKLTRLVRVRDLLCLAKSEFIKFDELDVDHETMLAFQAILEKVHSLIGREAYAASMPSTYPKGSE